MPNPGVTLGMTVMPEFVQVEGIDQVLENVVHRCRASSVALAPSLLEPWSPSEGSREPPSDSGAGMGRVLDRQLWGRYDLHVRSAPSFAPNRELYEGLAFSPPEPDHLTDREGPKVAEFLDALKRENVETQFQIMAAMPPGYRVQSRGALADGDPITVDGRIIPGRVDANLSLAHPELRAYVSALIHDLIDHYPDVDVMRFDWPEYPPYHPDSLLVDFHPSAMRLGEAHGFDVKALQTRLSQFGPVFAALLPADRLAALAEDIRPGAIPLADSRWPVLAELISYRRMLVIDYAKFLAETVAHASSGRMRCHFLCFPPPFNTLSGFDIGEIDRFAADISVKIYSMHWSMIERAYVERLLELGAGDADICLRLVRTILGTSADLDQKFADVHYPRPDEPHAASDELMEGKIRAAAAQTKQARLWALAHSYGPIDDVMRRFYAACRAASHVHINRYGYVSDEKITAIADFMRNGEPTRKI